MLVTFWMSVAFARNLFVSTEIFFFTKFLVGKNKKKKETQNKEIVIRRDVWKIQRRFAIF